MCSSTVSKAAVELLVKEWSQKKMRHFIKLSFRSSVAERIDNIEVMAAASS